MSTPTTTARRRNYRLQVNKYDRASSLLVALLYMVGAVMAAIAIIYFARKFTAAPPSVVVTPFDPGDRPLENPTGVALDPEPPGIEDAPELEEPQLMDTLNALTSTMSTKAAILSDQQLDAGDAVGKGSGLGDMREAGGGGGGKEPSWVWKYDVGSTDEYTGFFEFYNLRILVVPRNGDKVYFISNLGQASPTVEEFDRDAPELNKQFRMQIPQGNPLRGPTLTLIKKTNLSFPAPYIFISVPNEAYSQLAQLEKESADGKSQGEIRQTTYRISTEGGGYKFAVEEQIYY